MPQPIDDHFLQRYRELLDAEDSAFDGLQHACEEGNRPEFDGDMAAWRDALTRKLTFLDQAGFGVRAH